MKALVRVAVVLVVLAAVVVGGLGVAGVVQVPVVSSVAGMDRPRDLGGLPADRAAYQAFVTAHGFRLPSPAGNYTLGSAHTFSGSVPLDEVVGEAEINAMGELANPSPAFRQVTMRFHDGYAEASAMVDLASFGYPFAGPVYGRWTVVVTGPKSVSVDVSSLEFGRVPVPAEVAKTARDALNTYLTGRLATIDGLRIGTFALEEGGVHFAGSLPETYEAGTPAAGRLP